MRRDALAIAWPAALEGALLSIIGTVDTIMVKQVHEYAIASVNLTSQPRMILLILAQALCVGTTALVSRRRGEDDRQGANDALSLSMLLITCVGIFIALTGFFLAKPIIRLAGGDQDTTAMAVDYLRVVALGLPFNCWNLCMCAALRATGNTRVTMVTNMSANIVNVIMNYCLIGGHFGFPALKVKGAALATDIGSMVACMISLYVITRKSGYLKLRPRFRGFDKRTIVGLLKVGSSSIAESAALRIGSFMNNRLIAGINADALTSNTIVGQVTSLSFCLGDGVATAGATLTGVSLGEKRKDRARGYARICSQMGLIISCVLIALFFFLRKDLARLFT
ncbi:MAG: MATE family efflux transporter, partial [Clostridia bacterium]|nr:MATE family efflux transporter [Clostridia bacterium]